MAANLMHSSYPLENRFIGLSLIFQGLLGTIPKKVPGRLSELFVF